jgi:hypothetical protein
VVAERAGQWWNWQSSDGIVQAEIDTIEGNPLCQIFNIVAVEKRKGHGRRALQELRAKFSSIRVIGIGSEGKANRPFWFKLAREGLLDVMLDIDGRQEWPVQGEGKRRATALNLVQGNPARFSKAILFSLFPTRSNVRRQVTLKSLSYRSKRNGTSQSNRGVRDNDGLAQASGPMDGRLVPALFARGSRRQRRSVSGIRHVRPLCRRD